MNTGPHQRHQKWDPDYEEPKKGPQMLENLSWSVCTHVLGALKLALRPCTEASVCQGLRAPMGRTENNMNN